MQFCEIIGCFNCEQVWFQSAPMLETGQTRCAIKEVYLHKNRFAKHEILCTKAENCYIISLTTSVLLDVAA